MLNKINQNKFDKILNYRSIWISDFHLGTRGCQSELLLEFIKHTQSEKLYLVGDIIDGWALKNNWYWPQSHNDVVQKILRKARNGTKVFYLSGNHDEVTRGFAPVNFGGVSILNQIIHETVDKKKYLVVHGDQFDGIIQCAKWLAMLGSITYDFLIYFNRYINFFRKKLGYEYWSLSNYLKFIQINNKKYNNLIKRLLFVSIHTPRVIPRLDRGTSLESQTRREKNWIPAFAGMTRSGGGAHLVH